MIFWNYLSLIGWWLTLVFIIRRGLIDKKSGYSIIAVLCVFPWNIVYGTIYYDSLWMVDRVSTLGYLPFDLIFIWTILKYTKDDVAHIIPPRFFSTFLLGSLAIVTGLQYFLYQYISHFSPDPAAAYPSIWFHTQALYMIFWAMSFIVMLLFRKNTKGQSIYFPILSMIFYATYFPSGYFHYQVVTSFLWYLGGIYYLLFSIYFVMLYKQFQKEGINPWRHI